MGAKMNEFTPRLIKNDNDLQSFMTRIIELAERNPIEGTKEFDELELLGILIEHYESKHYPISKPDPIDAIKFRMEQQGLTNEDMTQFMGSLSKVSEVLNRKRPLSLSMIRRLHDGLGIPADILIQDMNDVEWLEIDAKLTSEKFNFAITPEVSDQDNYENSLSRMRKFGSSIKKYVKDYIFDECSEKLTFNESDKIVIKAYRQASVPELKETESVKSDYCFVG